MKITINVGMGVSREEAISYVHRIVIKEQSWPKDKAWRYTNGIEVAVSGTGVFSVQVGEKGSEKPEERVEAQREPVPEWVDQIICWEMERAWMLSANFVGFGSEQCKQVQKAAVTGRYNALAQLQSVLTYGDKE